jgi:hypothetical protein
LVLLLAFSGREFLLSIYEFLLSSLLQHVSLLLLDHHVIQLFGLGSQFILGNSIGSFRGIQCLGQLGLSLIRILESLLGS